jgi:uncharacterized membrane protein
LDTQQQIPVVTYEPLRIIEARKVGLMEPFQWLKLGWQTFTALRTPALVFGVTFAAIGALISYGSMSNPQMVFAFWSGFLLVAPVLAMATYHMAQSHEEGRSVSFGSCGRLLRRNLGNTLLLTLLLAVVMVAWIRISTLTTAVYTGGMSVQIDLSGSFFDMSNLGLLATLGVVTVVFSLLMFALLAWSMPMLARGKQHFATAIASSFAVIVKQPAPMLVWGGLIAGLTLLSMASYFIAFAIVFPWLAFATWEAYKSLFETE